MKPSLLEELIKNRAVILSIVAILLGILAIGNSSFVSQTKYPSNSSPNASGSLYSASENLLVSEIYPRTGFALLSVGAGGLFSMLVIIQGQRRRREHIYTTILKCLFSLSSSILLTLIIRGAEHSSIPINGSSQARSITMNFQHHLEHIGNAIDDSYDLLSMVENALQNTVTSGEFDISAYQFFLERNDNTIQYLLVNLLPTALELTNEVETRNYLDELEGACHILRIRLSSEDWIAHEPSLQDFRSRGVWNDYRSYVLHRDNVGSHNATRLMHPLEESILGGIEAIGNSERAYVAILHFSQASTILIEQLTELLSIQQMVEGTDIIDAPRA
jgi:hypothetical protein